MMATPFAERATVLAQAYLTALAQADAPAVLALFHPSGRVHSPLYGVQQAQDFYPQLFDDSRQSTLQLHDVLTHAERRTLALYFRYEWTLASGQRTVFDCVDWLALDSEDRILQLHILYDTAQTRAAWQSSSS